MQDDETETIHRLVLVHGKERAKDMVDCRFRSLVDIAAEVMADEEQKIGISYTGFALTGLPHKKLADDEPWEKRGHRVTLLVEPGRTYRNGQAVMAGVPYGARARMILLYLQTQATRTGSREVELGRSMRAWLERMGIAVGGETARSLKDQADRISSCSLKFFWQSADGQAEGYDRGGIVRSGLRFQAGNGTQESLWEDRVILDEIFWQSLRKHPVPLLEAAIRQLHDRSMSLDIYVWLAWRLHQLQKVTPISWPSMHAQFGAGYKLVRQFKPRFTEALAAATAAYPGAKIEVGENGVLLHPSRPPISRLAEKRHLTPHYSRPANGVLKLSMPDPCEPVM